MDTTDDDPTTPAPAAIRWEALPAPLLVLGDGGVVTAANPAATALLGVDAAVLTGRPLVALVGEVDAAEVAAVVDAGGGEVACTVTAGDGRVPVRLRVGGGVAALEARGEAVWLEALIDALADRTMVLDADALVVWQSHKLARRFEDTDHGGLGVNPLERVHPEDLPPVLDAMAAAVVSPGVVVRTVARSRAVIDHDVWAPVEIAGVSALGQPPLDGIVVQVRELDEGELVASVGETEGRYLSLADAAPIGIVVADAYARSVYSNAAARRLLGAGETGRLVLAERVRDEHRDAFDGLLAAALHDAEVGVLTAAFDQPDGSTRWLRVHATPRFNEGRQAIGVIATLEDVSAEVEARAEATRLEEQLRTAATHDHLTGLPNRPLFHDRLEQAVGRHRRERRGVAVMFCDVDGFKPVNDQHGHAAGDHVLRIIADRLRHVTREVDTAARVGGDEFVVVCEAVTDTDELAQLAERVIDAVTAPITLPDGTKVRVGISIGVGVARSRQENVDPDTLLTLADTAMYRAKARGGNVYRIAALQDD